MVAKKKTKFMCQSCGYESPKWMGKCPGCGEWNKMVEEVEIVKPGRRGAFAHSETQIGRASEGSSYYNDSNGAGATYSNGFS